MTLTNRFEFPIVDAEGGVLDHGKKDSYRPAIRHERESKN